MLAGVYLAFRIPKERPQDKVLKAISKSEEHLRGGTEHLGADAAKRNGVGWWGVERCGYFAGDEGGSGKPTVCREPGSFRGGFVVLFHFDKFQGVYLKKNPTHLFMATFVGLRFLWRR